MIWTCNCGHQNSVDYATNKNRLICKLCKALYLVRGLHIDGSPMLACMNRGETIK
ncbi:hypothetical protein ACFLUJ_08710 [Chloroflexota bacterium]